ncbi:hypothetical protein [Actinomadura violacea]|uniref:Uncharacterized protein n=1 Tax=Actinomadura violacea TaxID=2819934 RepID=A0ABS3RZT6_9ACTN|nr:hypothetical protein [Actinomadura violacea]MBO2461559.1 hypothetical protein [Actinomadura violacea]
MTDKRANDPAGADGPDSADEHEPVVQHDDERPLNVFNGHAENVVQIAGDVGVLNL